MSKRSNKFKIFLLFCLSLSELLCSCSSKVNTSSIIVKLPWTFANGEYQYEDVEITTLSQWPSMAGEAAHFHAPTQIVDDKISGPTPDVDYVLASDKVVIPITRESTELLSIYAHFERLQKIDKELKIPESDEARDIGFMARFKDETNNEMVNNAMFIGKFNGFLFVPYNLDDLPLSINSGVIAHEHFHSIFNRLVLKNTGYIEQINSLQINDKFIKQLLPHYLKQNSDQIAFSKEKQNELFNIFVIRGLNEGLADVWGWLYSNDQSFVQRSLTMVNKTRDLQVQNFQFLNLQEIKNYIKNASDHDKNPEVNYYEIGTNVARTFFLRAMENKNTDLTDTEKLFWRKRLVQKLINIQAYFVQLFNENKALTEDNKKDIDLYAIVDQMFFADDLKIVNNCEKWNSYFPANAKMPELKKACPNLIFVPNNNQEIK